MDLEWCTVCSPKNWCEEEVKGEKGKPKRNQGCTKQHRIRFDMTDGSYVWKGNWEKESHILQGVVNGKR